MIVIFVIIFVIIDLLLVAVLMPLPFNDNRNLSYNSVPFVTMALIAINCIVFILWQWPDFSALYYAETDAQQYQAMSNYYQKVATYGYRASFMREGLSIGGFVAFTSMFMHGGFGHLIGNMVFLWAFGPRVEDACGHWRFLLYYLFAGVMVGLADGIIISPAYDIPSIGASGAIAGVMGAYVVLFPGHKIDSLWIVMAIVTWPINLIASIIRRKPKPVFRWAVPVPTLFLMLIYVASDMVDTFSVLETRQLSGGVNYLAHTVGFLSAVVILLFVRKDVFTRYFAGRVL